MNAALTAALLLGSWSWQNPLPTANLLQAIAHPGGATYIAAGEAGTILLSSDGGASWVRQTSGTGEMLRAISFPDPMHGWIAGGNGLVLRTSDGAKSWKTLHTGATEPLRGISFADATNGTAVGDHGTILWTTDSGESWKRSNVAAGGLRAVALLNPRTAVAVGEGGAIARTTDSGGMWHVERTGTDLFAVSFVNDLAGFAVGGEAGNIFDRQVVLRTMDGGATWQKQSTGSRRRLYGVSFADANNGIAAGEKGTVLRTYDGGAHWKAQTAADAPWLLAVAMVDLRTAVAVGAGGAVYRTENGGDKWQAQSQGSKKALNAVYFSDDKTGVAVGGNGTILRTTDGGLEWRPQSSPVEQALNGVHFLNANVGMVVGEKGIILKTTDGGAHWTRFRSGADDGWGDGELRAVFVQNESTAIAVGRPGILRTADGGTTWKWIRTQTDVFLTSIFFTDSSHGIAVGGGGTALLTRDGGLTWAVRPTGTLEALYGVHFSDARHGMAVGSHGAILDTSDGGETWTGQASGTTENLRGIHVLNEANAIAAGSHGTILHTTDGGRTWTRESGGVTSHLRAIAVTPSPAMIAVGMDGVIVRSGPAPQAGIGDQFRGMLRRPRTDLDPTVEKPNDITVIHGKFHSEPREEVPFLIWRPAAAKRRLPSVILLHGTCDSKEDMSDIGRRLAMRGLLAIAIDGRYHGERIPGGCNAYNEAIVRAWRERDPARQEHPLYYDTVYDVGRTVDYLETREDVDAQRIGAAGISKGGIEAWMAAAADERIRAVVPDIAVQSFAWSFSHDRWQGRVRTVWGAAQAAAKDMGKSSVDAASARALFAKVLPGIFDQFDCTQMLPAIAPRPMLILSGDQDPNNPIEGAEFAFAAARAAYRRQNAEERLRIEVGKGLGHDTPEEHVRMMVDWLAKWLR